MKCFNVIEPVMTIYAMLVHAYNSKSLQFSAFHVHFCFVELLILTNAINSNYPLKG